jgi:hypothetical protein
MWKRPSAGARMLATAPTADRHRPCRAGWWAGSVNLPWPAVAGGPGAPDD